MANDNIQDEELVRVMDILDQVKQLNKLIAMHKNENPDQLMVV